MKVSAPRIMIAAPGSNSGKTTVTTAILRAYVNEGRRVAAYKAGPDYIDPMFHTEVINVPSRNLDLFMLGENNCRVILGRNSRDVDVSVIEGVMGYYDGAGIGTSYSSYELAKALSCPVVLVIDCKGIAASICALIEGFVKFRPDSGIRGVILNNTTANMYAYYKRMIETNTDVKVYGYLPYMDDCVIGSRHLGLITAQEIGNLQYIVKELGRIAENTIDMDGLAELASEAEPVCCKEPVIERLGDVRIGLAVDRAFCFYYRDSLELLESMGAKLVRFSPLKDMRLPEGISGLYIGGGYPELYMQKLSANSDMREDIRKAVGRGMPVFAECGGYMYLMDEFQDEGGCDYPMIGISEGKSYMTKSLKNFGYITLTATKDNLMCQKGDSINAHEFHYSDSTVIGDTFEARKPESERQWKCIESGNRSFMGYPHLHLMGNIKFAEGFIRGCIEYMSEVEEC